jgi:adenine-specific DNA-methyltransferase
MKKYTNEKSTVFHGDVLECFSEIKECSVDLVFADPPYNIGKDFNGIKDEYDPEEYIIWMKKWIKEIHRVLTPTGSVYLMNSTQNFAHMDLISREYFTILSRIVWSYDSSGVQAKMKFGSSWEPILHMVKDEKKYTFNSKDVLVEAKTGSKRKLIDYRKTPPQPYNTQKVPTNVWEIPRVRFKMDEYEDHPTQKPLKLLKRVILASSNPNDTVLDPFCGSFSTGFTAVSLDRKFIGFELNEDFIKIGIRRLNLPSEYSTQELKKRKERKTKNKSKKDHNKGFETPSLFDDSEFSASK